MTAIHKPVQYVIYVPGLGDSRIDGQQKAINTWKFWGVQAEIFQMNWADGEAFQPKFERLLNRIDTLLQKGDVSLVCASAGATAAVNAYAARPQIKALVCIAGKINNPMAVGEGYKRKNPAFWESMQLTNESVNKLDETRRARIRSIRALADPIVPARDSIVPGVQNKVSPTIGHAVTIALQIVFGAPFFLRFIKQLPAEQQ